MATSGVDASCADCGKASEHAVELLRERRRIDRADDRDLQIVAPEKPRAQSLDVGSPEPVQRFEIAAQRPAVDMPGKSRFAIGLGDHGVRVLRLALEARHDLSAHTRDRLFLEARLVDREAQQLEAVVERARQRLEMAREMVAIGPETKVHRQILDSAMEGARVVGPSALIENAGEQRGQPLLALRVLRGAAAGRKLHRDQGHGVALDEPGLDAAGALHALHSFGARALSRQ